MNMHRAKVFGKHCSWTTRAVVLGILVAGSAGLSGCDQPSANTDGKAKAPPAAAPPVLSVSISQPVVSEVVEWDEYSARFDAVESVEVRVRISGHLTQVLFKDGQTVKKGDLLFVIDPRPFERALEQARAELGQAKTKTENSMLDVDRGRPLMERKVLSEKAFDDRANILRDAQSAVKIAEAKIATAELDLSFTRVISPIDGLIGRALVTPGNWVNAGTISTATMLTSIVRQNPVHIYFDVSENNYLKYKRLMQRGISAGAGQAGNVIEISMPDEVGFPHKGKLDFIDNRLDPGTATLRARAIVENDKNLFSPGMFARVRIAGSAKYPAVMIPDEAVASDQANKYVLVVGEDGLVARRNIKVGPLHAGLRIIRDGVKPDDWVIVRGARARPGQRVNPKREPIKMSDSSAIVTPLLTPAAVRN